MDGSEVEASPQHQLAEERVPCWVALSWMHALRCQRLPIATPPCAVCLLLLLLRARALLTD